MERMYRQIEMAKRQRVVGEYDEYLEDFIGYLHYRIGQYYSRKFHKFLGIKRVG